MGSADRKARAYAERRNTEILGYNSAFREEQGTAILSSKAVY